LDSSTTSDTTCTDNLPDKSGGVGREHKEHDLGDDLVGSSVDRYTGIALRQSYPKNSVNAAFINMFNPESGAYGRNVIEDGTELQEYGHNRNLRRVVNAENVALPVYPNIYILVNNEDEYNKFFDDISRRKKRRAYAHVDYIALRDIEPGEELFLCYGRYDLPWKTHCREAMNFYGVSLNESGGTFGDGSSGDNEDENSDDGNQ